MTSPTPPAAPVRQPSVVRLLLHVGRLVLEAVRYAMATRRFSLVAAIVLGIILLALTVTAQSAAPLLLYPFA